MDDFKKIDKEFDEKFIVLKSGQLLERSELKEGIKFPKETLKALLSFLHQKFLERDGEWEKKIVGLLSLINEKNL